MDARDIIPAAVTALAVSGFGWFVWNVLFLPHPTRRSTPIHDVRIKPSRPETLRDMQIHTVGGGRPQNDPQTVADNVVALLPDITTLDAGPGGRCGTINASRITADKLTVKEVILKNLNIKDGFVEFSSPSREDKIGASE